MLLVLLVVSGVFCGSAAADNPDVQNAQNLSDALNLTTDSGEGAAYVNDEGKVILLQDVWLNYTINITAQDSITLTANESNDFTIYRNFGDEFLFNVSYGTFILEGSNGHNLTIDGNITAYSSNGNSLVYVEGGEFTMNAGSVLQNSNNARTLGGGGVNVSGGTFNMNGGTISNNNAYSGGGVYFSSGTITMTRGTISGNTANDGGGVYMEDDTFTMNDGTISNNTVTNYGGGVYMEDGTFTMNDGTISGNTAANYGGGVCVYRGTFNMNDGEISNNTAYSGGSGVFAYWGTFNMTGGTISGNNATERGGGVFVYGGTFTMNSSGTVDSDNDVYLYYNRFVTVTGNLASDAGSLNITPAFTSGTVIRYIDGVSPETWTDNFALNQTWAIDNPTLDLAQSGNDIILGTNCTVNFCIDETTIYLSQYNVSGTLLAQPADPTRSGYTFNGWNTTNASGTSWNFSTTRIAGNTSLYANWTVNPTPTPTPTSSENGDNDGNDDNNADFGPVSANGIFTTNDGGLTLHYPAGSSIIVTVFRGYFNGAAAPSGVSYLNVYDVHSTADSETSVTLVFRVNASLLENKGLTPEDISILRCFDGKWERMTITSIERVDGEYLFTVTSDRTSVFMIACNVDGSWFPLEEAEETSTPTTGPTLVEPTVLGSTINPTKAASSPVPVLGIIAGLLGMALLTRRE